MAGGVSNTVEEDCDQSYDIYPLDGGVVVQDYTLIKGKRGRLQANYTLTADMARELAKRLMIAARQADPTSADRKRLEDEAMADLDAMLATAPR